MESSLAKHVTNGQVHGEEFDVNFIEVEEGDLEELAKHQSSGILPKEA